MDKETFSLFLYNLDAFMAEDGPTMEELEVQVYGICIWFQRVLIAIDIVNELNPGRRVTEDLSERQLMSPSTCPSGSYLSTSHNQTFHGLPPLGPVLANRSPPSLAPSPNDNHYPFESPEQTAKPPSPIVEILSEPPSPQLPPRETVLKYVMEVHIVTKSISKPKRGKANEDQTTR
jgi:hypothetical protein